MHHNDLTNAVYRYVTARDAYEQAKRQLIQSGAADDRDADDYLDGQREGGTLKGAERQLLEELEAAYGPRRR